MNSNVEVQMVELFGTADRDSEGTESSHSEEGGGESGKSEDRGSDKSKFCGAVEGIVAQFEKKAEKDEDKAEMKEGQTHKEEKAEKSPFSLAAGMALEIELGQGTVGRCGACQGCLRDACGLCSLCKRGAFEDCIDKYCSEEETGRLQRAHMKELYLAFQYEKKPDNGMCCSYGHQANPIKEEPLDMDMDIKDEILNDDDPGRQGTLTKTAKVRSYKYVYGSGPGAKKARRCGECEGCTRLNCGACKYCLAGVDYMKRMHRRCLQRTCHMRGVLGTIRSV